MADLARTVSIIFSGEDSGLASSVSRLEGSLRSLDSTVGSVSGGMGRLSQGLETATQPIANITLGALKFEAALLSAGAGMTLFAVKTASDFDTAFRQITTLFDGSTEEVAQFREAIVSFAQNSSQPLKSITDALQAAIGSGVPYAQSIDLIRTAEQLAVATRAELKGTTEVLVSTLNSYGLTTNDAGRISDLFFQIIKDGKIEMNDLSHSLAMVTPLAAASGVSIEEVGAAVATLTVAGIPASAAIEYLRSLLSNIIKPSKDAGETADALGIQYGAAALKANGLSGVLRDMAGATHGNTEQMSKLVGDIGGLTAALALTGPQAGKFAEVLGNMSTSAGATAAAFAKMSGSLDVATAQMTNAFKTMLVQIGTPLLEEFGGIANAIARIFVALGDSVRNGGLGTVVTFIEGIFGDLEQTLTQVAINLPAALAKANFSGFTGGVQSVVDAFSRLFRNIDLSTVDGLTRAIELAGAAFLGLSRFTAGVVDSFQPLFDMLVKVGSEAGKTDSAFFQVLGNMAGVVTQVNLLAGGINSLLPSIEALLNIVLLRSGVGLIGAFGSMAVALPALTFAMTAFGVAIAGVYAGDKIYQLIDGLVQLKTANENLAESQRVSTQVHEGSISTLARFAETTGIAAKSIDDALEMVRNGTVVWDDATNSWVKADKALATVNTTALSNLEVWDDVTKSWVKAGGAALSTLETWDEVTKSWVRVGGAAVDASGKADALGKTVSGTGTAAANAAPNNDKVTKSIKETAKEAEKAQEAADKYRLELEKLASNERIKLIEAKVQLSIAGVEANARIAVASFESINNTVTSTGNALSDLFKLFGNPNLSWSELSQIRNQIELENKRRDEALALQKMLIEAQIRQIEAQTRALDKGDALIKIDGAGLQPHLEAFMFEILRTIQTRVNQQGLDLLLAIPIR